MGQYVSAAFAIVLLALVTVSGMSLAGAFEARATLSAITVMAAADMAIDGGYTSAVQSAIQSALTAHGLTGTASVSVSVPADADGDGDTAGTTAYYGDTYTVSITYDLPVALPGGALSIPVTTSAPGVSTYPCTAVSAAAGNCAAPAAIPGGSV